MYYEFSILEKNEKNYVIDYKVNVCVKDQGMNVLITDKMVVKYDKNIGMVLLNQDYIKSIITDRVVRLDLISKLKLFIKENNSN
ncbi:hypothetical protein [Clostridium sporogenes]|uniref:hypothetical protein n=1 Tax=Clostridium sporogenes TaxID=1509 RepID=UPI0001794E58|nr:hypothetical protein [Clostridium sporogenes]EDU36718.1 hypothetical protein CLOSPO_02887 [Clostridium sporogenes ATCC 15579]NFE65960.1 hypothetical protein [Clostridium sporogenes]